MWEYLKDAPIWIVAVALVVISFALIWAIVTGRDIRIGKHFVLGPPAPRPTKPGQISAAQAKNYLKKHPDPPSHYSFEYLKHFVAATYGPDAGILVLRYGSQTTVGTISPNDRDYIVLVHGNYYDGETEKIELGTRTPTDSLLTNGIDIHIRLFDSFLIGLIMGRPFEVSVAHVCEFEDSHQIEKDYVKWIHALCEGLLTRAPAVAAVLRRDLVLLREKYEEVSQTEAFGFSNIIAAYHYICDLVKIRVLGEFPEDPIPVVTMYPLSQVSYLEKHLPEALLPKFRELVSHFKRNSIPPSRGAFEQIVRELRNGLETQ